MDIENLDETISMKVLKKFKYKGAEHLDHLLMVNNDLTTATLVLIDRNPTENVEDYFEISFGEGTKMKSFVETASWLIFGIGKDRI